MIQSSGQGLSSVVADIAEGMRAMCAVIRCCSRRWFRRFGVGVFSMGTFLVNLPIVNADVYRHEAGGSRNIVVTFWAGAVFSLVAISGLRKLTRLGRLLLIANSPGLQEFSKWLQAGPTGPSSRLSSSGDLPPAYGS
jgi:hypothetical protein